jgi:hypothetical protein
VSKWLYECSYVGSHYNVITMVSILEEQNSPPSSIRYPTEGRHDGIESGRSKPSACFRQIIVRRPNSRKTISFIILIF